MTEFRIYRNNEFSLLLATSFSLTMCQEHGLHPSEKTEKRSSEIDSEKAEKTNF